jgi:hypothetical protein
MDDVLGITRRTRSPGPRSHHPGRLQARTDHAAELREYASPSRPDDHHRSRTGAPPVLAYRERRQLLRDGDALLELVERLRLADQAGLPPLLAQRIGDWALRVPGAIPLAPLRTLAAAHDAVLELQGKLMGRPADPCGRGGGRPPAAEIRLPPMPPAGPGAAWWAAAQEATDQALWRYAEQQRLAARAARLRRPDRDRWLQRAQAAWANYWRLYCELEAQAATLPTPPGG